MLIEVKVPQLSGIGRRGDPAAWHKKPGEAVKRDEILVDIETDKVVLEVPAPAAGVLAEVVQGRRRRWRGQEVIAQIDTEAKAAAAPAPAASAGAGRGARAGAAAEPPVAAGTAAAPASRCRRRAS